MKQILILISILIATTGFSQSNVTPAPAQKGVLFIKNATIHTGNGKVIENGVIQIKDGKIAAIGAGLPVPADVQVVDAKGKHVYPGLILPTSNLGLVEISSNRATSDVREIGDLNPSVRSIVAYNTDSKVINTLRSNGILLANIVPQGSALAGSSSVVQLDAWTWDDAAYKMDAGQHYYMPSLMPRARFGGGGGGGGRNMGGDAQPDPVKEGLEQVEKVKTFFREAKAYNATATHDENNLKMAAVKGLFDKSQKLYVHANTVKQMLLAIDFVKEFGFDVTIVGGSESWQIADLRGWYYIQP